jgi:triosephosphate isomerase
MYIFANFKDYLDYEEAQAFVHRIVTSETVTASKHTIVIFPSLLAFADIARLCSKSLIGVGVQQSSDGMSAARTGEVSPEHAKAAGAQYVLVGHSEQRHIGGETDALIARKCAAVLAAGLIPVLCVGETKAELDAGTAHTRISEQLSVLRDLKQVDTCIIAYEPVWAIQGSGSGAVCAPSDVAAMHAFIQSEVARYTTGVLPILFGGSVNSENIVSYTSLPNVDGVLVGSAATRIDSFDALIHAVAVL